MQPWFPHYPAAAPLPVQQVPVFIPVPVPVPANDSHDSEDEMLKKAFLAGAAAAACQSYKQWAVARKKEDYYKTRASAEINLESRNTSANFPTELSQQTEHMMIVFNELLNYSPQEVICQLSPNDITACGMTATLVAGLTFLTRQVSDLTSQIQAQSLAITGIPADVAKLDATMGSKVSNDQLQSEIGIANKRINDASRKVKLVQITLERLLQQEKPLRRSSVLPVDLGRLERGLNQIQGAPTTPQRKLYVLKVHFLPSLVHVLTFASATVGLLPGIDRRVGSFVRGVLRLPTSVPTAFHHAPLRHGGLQIPSFEERVPLLKRSRFSSLRISECEAVRLALPVGLADRAAACRRPSTLQVSTTVGLGACIQRSTGALWLSSVEFGSPPLSSGHKTAPAIHSDGRFTYEPTVWRLG
ncbi:unnamed protein product [Bemisia tabaci]|uniref:Uncharacterized protein n=1 Tax=Bemisia tabaci TaxID=7038 RepID=A0A9P0F4R3_BEMTA|nr:unnamed protein product [Bemisia tabaci]